MKKLLVLFSLTTSQLFAASVGYWQIPLNLNASQLTSGTVPTNVLPGALGTLSTWNGGGALTNTASPQQTIYTNSGTASLSTNYTIPVWAKTLILFMQAGGGGGGSGALAAAGAAAGGGSGGGGGASTYVTLNAAQLRSISNVWQFSIGGRGTGGASQTTNSSSGLAGTAGGLTRMQLTGSADAIAVCLGGSGGLGGTTGATAGGAGGTAGTWVGGSGGAAGTGGGTGAASDLFLGNSAAGGGAGGGVNTSDAPNVGTRGGQSYTWNASNGFGAAGATNSAGGNPSRFSVLADPAAYPGAGGGGASTSTNGGAGGVGEYGSGGGGGGGARDGVGNSGAGGNGGGGFVRITAY